MKSDSLEECLVISKLETGSNEQSSIFENSRKKKDIAKFMGTTVKKEEKAKKKRKTKSPKTDKSKFF